MTRGLLCHTFYVAVEDVSIRKPVLEIRSTGKRDKDEIKLYSLSISIQNIIRI